MARDAGTDLLEDEAWRRAYSGTERPVFQNGALVGKTREYSDLLMELLLKGRRPEKFRDKQARGQRQLHPDRWCRGGDEAPDARRPWSSSCEAEPA